MLIRPNFCKECRESAPRRGGQVPSSPHLCTLGLIEWSLGSFITVAGGWGGGRTDSPWRWQSRPSDTEDDFSPRRACRDQTWLESNWPWNECLPPLPQSWPEEISSSLTPPPAWQMWSTTTGGHSGTVSLLFDISTAEGEKHTFFSWIEIRQIFHPKATCLKV